LTPNGSFGSGFFAASVGIACFQSRRPIRV
jgi:hypothetical protein